MVFAIVEPYSSQPKQSRNVNQPEIVSTFRRFEENAPTLNNILQILSELVLVVVWLIDASLGCFLWLLNEAVTSCTEFILRIFGALFHIVKLLEAFGFGLKFLLELNYALVSYLFDTAGFLRESFNHALTLVKITLANETDHVYESSSMAFEGVQNLFLTTCNTTWVTILFACEKIHGFFLMVVDNFTTHFGFPIPNVSLIASMLFAGVTFFMESIVVTAGVVQDGMVFLFKYIGGTILEFGTRVLSNTFVIFNIILQAITMVINHIISIVTWPFAFLGDVVSKIMYLLCTLWETIIKQACYLDELVRGVIWSIFQMVAQFISAMVSKTLLFTKTYIPGGIVGLCIIFLALIGLLVWRKRISSLLSSAWSSLRRLNANIGEDIPEDDFEIEDEEFAVDETTEEVEPEMSHEAKDQHKLNYELQREKDKRLCVICQDKIKNVLLLPCRHVCLCHRCMQEIRHGRVQLLQCPLCRQYIQSTMEVFV